ncbi:MAG TPA: sugar ABC transporter ATP-binding protein [Thermotogota bacterium]|jgi:ribose transport system ATP-binding protein|nr:sugar ABC transporter ATP-binding protein [Thermotogota bacterium]NLH18961.1 sugar ABC transporter ATP-binding protein [Thermotogaceae bacterium]OQC32770.1 MAG: Ribose import ATP-binding protein RbsA [Thermotogota bacterium ADurb.Bin062]HNW46636.1 sugar ABC transporter ATP-binding protein [Thermotogota bacterium]HOD90191.1 sugar ABC transporter ATP-binding protein [Thermotogota bacterium]
MDPVAEKEIPLLEVKGISKEFSGVRVLDRVSFSLSRGEIFGIIGENGAGKSTLIKIISGIYHPTEGSLLFEGKSVTVRDAETAHKMGINLIPQEFNLIPEMTVSENIFLGKELRNRWFLDKRAMIEKTRSLLEHLRSDIAADARIESLSVAQKQMVEFAKALASESKLLILDEPTTVLTRKEIDILFEIMRQAKQSGVAMIYISHKLKEVKEICDKVMVLRDGKLISIESSEHLGVHDMATKMVGRELSQIFPPKAKPQEDTVLQVRNLSVPNCLEGVSFDLKRGEILGFAGLVGAGRTELAETLIGIRKKSAGTILLNGKEVYVKNPTRAFASGLAYLSEDRQGSGILTAFGITENITLTSLKRYSRFLLKKKEEALKAQEYVRKFDIKAASLKTRLEFFSGGNQQKVSFAKSLDSDPQIILIDEPTRGIDVQAKHEMYRFIHSLVEGGLSCVLISSEMEEVIGMSNRVVVMKEGRITGILTGDQINEEEIMFYATGLKGVA